MKSNKKGTGTISLHQQVGDLRKELSVADKRLQALAKRVLRAGGGHVCPPQPDHVHSLRQGSPPMTSLSYDRSDPPQSLRPGTSTRFEPLLRGQETQGKSQCSHSWR